MCGIVSIFSARRPVDRTLLKKATDALSHRGPDGEGFYISKNSLVGLGHRRLSIIDLSTGAQPISNAAGTIHIIVNGELYDFEDIRARLKTHGHIFKTNSDSEIALHLYAEKGLDFAHDLRGEFSLVIYDEARQRLIAARDRFGVKPLCYAQDDNGTLYIASEAKAILSAGFSTAWDDESFFYACNAQYTPRDRTLFKGIFQLEPAHMMVFENNRLRLQKYWDMDYPPEPAIQDKSDAEWIQHFKTAFEDSVATRLRADTPVCFHLSGGIDSAAVAATASRLKNTSVDCFTVRFNENSYDEYPVASEMATHMGARLHEVAVTQDDLVDYIPKTVYYSEGLAINGHLAGKFLLNRAIRKAGFKVALTGEGADEVLAGYPHFREDLIGAQGDEKIRQNLYNDNKKLAGLFLPHGETLATDAVVDRLGFLPSFLKAKASMGYRITSLLSQEYADNMKKIDVYQNLIDSFDIKGQLQGRNHVHQASYLWSKTALPVYILRTLGDGCEMAHSVEGRLPFLDHKLFDVIRTIPLHLKIKGMTEKHILREAMKDRLTDTLYRRQKHPFIAPPVNSFASKRMNGFIHDTLRSQKFSEMGFFDNIRVSNWLDQLDTQDDISKSAAEPVLMTMLTTYYLWQSFIGGDNFL